MGADNREITITLSAKNLTHAEFTKARTELAGLSDAADKAGKSAGGLGGFFRQAGAQMAGMLSASAVMGAVSAGFSAIGGAAIGMNADLEKSTLQFGTLMGDAGKAQAHVRDLFEFAKKTPFETGPIIAASKHLETFGGAALNNMKNLTLLGDAAAATGAPIEDLGFWVGRMYSNLAAGKPVGEAIARLTELGVISPETARQLEGVAASGKSVEEKFAVMQAGLGKFEGAMVAQANTWSGLTSSISDAVNIMMADALKPLFDLLKTGAQIALAALGSEGLGRAFTGLRDSIAGTLGTSTDGGAGLVKGFINGLLSGVDLGLAALGLFGQGWGGIKAVVYGAGAVITQTVSNMLAGFVALVDGAAKIPGIGDKFRGAAEGLHAAKDFADSLTLGFKDLTAEAWNAAQGHDTFGVAIAGARDLVGTLQQEIAKATIAQDDHAAATNRAAATKSGYIAKTKEQIQADKEAAKEHEKFVESVSFMGTAAGNWRNWQPLAVGALDSSTRAANEFTATFQRTITAIDASGRAWEPFKAAAKSAGAELTKLHNSSTSFSGTFSTAMQGLPKVMLGAIQGGGDVGKSVGASLGGSLGDWAGKAAGPALGNMFGKTIGGAVGTMFGPVGTMIGGFLGNKIGGLAASVFGKVFGGEGKKVNDMRDDFVAASGGIAALDAKAHAAGLTLDRLLKAKKVDDFKAAVEELNKAFGQSEADTALAREAMEEWGISAKDAGQKFAQADMDKTANAMLAKLKAATAAGVDLTAIVNNAGDDFGKMVTQAIKTGTTISNEFRPVLAAMIENGTLIDENGEKFTDLGQIPFAEDLGSGIKELNLTMKELADFFMHGMKDAIGNATSAGINFGDAVKKSIQAIPTNIQIEVDGVYNPPNIDGAAPGYDVGTLGRHGTYFVDYPQRGRAAILHNREAVITEDQAPGFVADWLSRNGLMSAAGSRASAPAAPSVGTLNVLVENKPDGTATARLIDDAEAFRRQHNRLSRAGLLSMPARSVVVGV